MLEKPDAGKKYRPVIVEKRKTCPVMKDRSTSIMNVSTPLDALIAAYDTLEVTRFLWRKQRTLHRDIGEGNIMVNKGKITPIPEMLKNKLEDMCFATALLGKDGLNPEFVIPRLQTFSPFLNPLSRADRLETPLLLIDFDVAENVNPTPGQESSGRTGAPYFMARAVRTPEISPGTHLFPPMPELFAGAARYQQFNGDRFPMPHPNELLWEEQDDYKLLEPFHHKLRYDAESVFWLLLWWCMLAKPSGDQNLEDFISICRWYSFTGITSSLCRVIRGTLHAEYKPLESLLQSMVNHLAGDYDILDDSDIRKHDEYLHEVFQRLIFDFLSEHLEGESEFLTLKKSSHRRRIEGEDPKQRPPPTPQPTNSQREDCRRASKRARKNREGDDDEEKLRLRKKVC
ncbi:hypothetical protein CPB86DRAFT_705832 [Serendipita vermifera]|nr:hypothetical protein CPB86DRAFT_705832 [Serendipita vermifera]